jgi:hypothetical protein
VGAAAVARIGCLLAGGVGPFTFTWTRPGTTGSYPPAVQGTGQSVMVVAVGAAPGTSTATFTLTVGDLGFGSTVVSAPITVTMTWS